MDKVSTYPQACCGHQSRVRELSLCKVLILTGDNKTNGKLAFYHTLFTSKFSCTGGVGHFPRWNACPFATSKRPASTESSSSAVIILVAGWLEMDLELEETKQLESSYQSLEKDFWAGRSLCGQSSHSVI